MKIDAIVLAGGRGSRMKSHTPKQYLELMGKPMLYYSLKAFEESFIDNVILVCNEGEEDHCRKDIVIKYGLNKVNKIVAGGRERFDSVYNGLMASDGCDYVYIHDGARPLISQYILDRCQHYVEKYRAAVAAHPAGDTIKLEDGNRFIASTPDRDKVWLMETPQVFEYGLARSAYEKLMASRDRLKDAGVHITDDTMVIKMFENVDAYLVEDKYCNIKVTRPEDMIVAEAMLESGDEL
ncbi:MAG: 2-C-methyl-D-erythritol 4-phosphate cytidylyltransferase [Lachnospiraceae bacterium]|nr:2-C-methyl-D-erythritol 4-phosphate cytidylyltransferase [Lachnospiraceae bacterium]